MRITGHVKLKLIRENRIIHAQEGENLVVNAGRTLIRNDCMSSGSPGAKYFALGDDDTLVTAADTELGNDLNIPTLARHLGTESYPGSYVISYSSAAPYVVNDTGSDEEVKEIGIFDSATHDAGTMLCRFLPQAFDFESNDSLVILWTLTFGD